MLSPWKKNYDKSKWCIKKKRHHFANKGLYSQSYDFSNSHVQMWEMDHKEGWAPKNWCFQNVVLEKTLESPLDSEIKPVHPKGGQSWIVIECLWCTETDGELKTLRYKRLVQWFSILAVLENPISLKDKKQKQCLRSHSRDLDFTGRACSMGIRTL